MTDTTPQTEPQTTGQASGQSAPQQAPQVRIQYLSQYIRDLSFENVMSRKGLQSAEVQPEVQFNVSLDAQRRGGENQYEVIQRYKITSRNRVNGDQLFLVEIEYGGLVQIDGATPEQSQVILFVQAPTMLFPFVRRIVSDTVRDGGFPPLNLEPVDFLAIYRQEIARRQQAAAAQPAAGAAAAPT